jgi:hypothetical protein
VLPNLISFLVLPSPLDSSLTLAAVLLRRTTGAAEERASERRDQPAAEERARGAALRARQPCGRRGCRPFSNLQSSPAPPLLQPPSAAPQIRRCPRSRSLCQWTNGCIRGYPLPAGNGCGQSFLSTADIGYGFGYEILVAGTDVGSEYPRIVYPLPSLTYIMNDVGFALDLTYCCN